MNFLQTSLLTTGLLAAAVAISAAPVSAATITYDFKVLPDSDPLLGNSYTGSFSYDDSSLSGSDEFQFLVVESLRFSFLGTDYDETNGLSAAEAAFLDGNFLGLSYVADDFAFVPGFVDLSDASFAYDIDAGVGFADVIYTQRQPEQSVPEPTSAIAVLLLGALGTATFRKQAV